MWQLSPDDKLVVNAGWGHRDEPDRFDPHIFTFKAVDDEMNRAEVMVELLDGDVTVKRVVLYVDTPDGSLDGPVFSAFGRRIDRLRDEAADAVRRIAFESGVTGPGAIGSGRDLGRRTTLTDEFLQEVAEAYQDSGRVIEEVRRRLDLSQRTAYRYVNVARERGFITEDAKEAN